MSLLSQVIEAGKNDDLEDSKSICDDTDVEVASEVWIFSKKLFCTTHAFRCQCASSSLEVKNAISLIFIYLSWVLRDVGFFMFC